MSEAKGYFVNLPKDRYDILLWYIAQGNSTFIESVNEFEHSRNSALVCFVIVNGTIMGITTGKRGTRSESEKRKLSLDLKLFKSVSINPSDVIGKVSAKFKPYVRDKFSLSGLSTNKVLQNTVEAIIIIDPSLKPLLDRFTTSFIIRMHNIPAKTKEVLAAQKDSAILSLSIAGIDKSEIAKWQPPLDGVQAVSFLDGLSNIRMREDNMIINDFSKFPDFELVKSELGTCSIFEAEGKELAILMANRMPLEEVLGVDLIYYNKTHNSFVFIQYKAMEKENDNFVFRFPEEQLTDEIKRMEAVVTELNDLPPEKQSAANYRLIDNPFFLKFCPRFRLNPDDTSMINGIYTPLAYWGRIADDQTFTGRKGGKILSYEKINRNIDNSLFARLVTDAWIGSTPNASEILNKLINAILQSGRALSLAVFKEDERRNQISTDEPEREELDEIEYSDEEIFQMMSEQSPEGSSSQINDKEKT